MSEAGVVPNSVKEKMRRGELAVSMTVRIFRGVEIAAIAKSAGFDCLYIDLEHCSFSLETVSQISIAARALGVTPLVRVVGHDPAEIGRTLETGAQGIIVPHVDTAEQAERIARAARLPPAGDRSVLATNPHTLFRGGPAAETMRQMNEATLVIVMIESAEGLANADAIAAVPGVDMILVGANDLCNSLGIPGDLESERIVDAYTSIGEACRRHGKLLGVGGLNTRPDMARRIIATGAHFMSSGSDTGFLLSAATAAAKLYR
jgi:2-keto-3-deoxy-L-rhamnonate aldolase RhmA